MARLGLRDADRGFYFGRAIGNRMDMKGDGP